MAGRILPTFGSSRNLYSQSLLKRLQIKSVVCTRKSGHDYDSLFVCLFVICRSRLKLFSWSSVVYRRTRATLR